MSFFINKFIYYGSYTINFKKYFPILLFFSGLGLIRPIKGWAGQIVDQSRAIPCLNHSWSVDMESSDQSQPPPVKKPRNSDDDDLWSTEAKSNYSIVLSTEEVSVRLTHLALIKALAKQFESNTIW